nr:MAG TPA: hypothetical protein [Caudoviricetes sp.]
MLAQKIRALAVGLQYSIQLISARRLVVTRK